MSDKIKRLIKRELEKATPEQLFDLWQEISNLIQEQNKGLRPFALLNHTSPEITHLVIQGEHPQTIAVILSYLQPEIASKVLERLPADTQSDVSRRICVMEVVSPETLREVERVIEKRLNYLNSHYDWSLKDGVMSAVEILRRSDHDVEKQIIEALEDEDPELAENLKEKRVTINDFYSLEKKDAQLALSGFNDHGKMWLMGHSKEMFKKVISVVPLKNKISLLMKCWSIKYTQEDIDKVVGSLMNQVREYEEKGRIKLVRKTCQRF